MSTERNATKQALIEAAGELFADLGFEGTSIRAITDKAGANVAAISYHFGGKEELYVQTVVYLIRCDTSKPVRTFLEQAGPEVDMSDVRKVIHTAAKESLAVMVSPDHPPWHSKLLHRITFEPCTARVEQCVDQTFRPDVADLMKLARLARPHMSDHDARLWAFAFMGQVSFYLFVRSPVLRELGREEYDEAFFESVADHVTDAMVAALGPACAPVTEGGA